MDMLFTRVRTCCRRESDESMGLYRAWASAHIGKIKGGVPQQTWPQQVPEEVMWRLQNARKPFSSGVTMGIVAAASSVGFVAAAVSMPMGGCRAIRSLVVVDVDVSVATELTVL